MDPEKQREANRRSYWKHREERLAKRANDPEEKKQARRDYHKAWRQRPENVERLKAIDRARAKQREANRKSYWKHHDERLAKRANVSEEKKQAKRDYQKKWRLENHERLIAWDRARWPERAEKQNARQKEQRRNRPKEEQHRIDSEFGFRKRYKRSIAWYDQKLSEQGNHCALCSAIHHKNRLHIDHNHACCKAKKSCGNCIRGLLCSRCNMKVGFLEELLREGDWVDRAKVYLNSYTVS